MEISKRNKNVSYEEIIEFEIKNNFSFDSDFREFLLECNGGIPTENQFDIVQTNNSAGITYFFSLTEIEDKYKSKRLLSLYIAIAEATGDNYICISKQSGNVFFWDHEFDHKGEDAFFLLAKNFNAFLDCLRNFDSKYIHLDPKQIKEVWIDPE
ncbi:MAG: SMI1/KNR4 family protein, partial [Calditrichaeota bacterium]|nr:SMI1/KNR4 family protein [Calditrichota bacterium]